MKLNSILHFVHKVIERLRDRQRRTRQRLERIFGKKTFTSIAVVGAMGKLLENSIVPFLDPSSEVPEGRLLAWVIVFIIAMVISIYWEHVANTAENVAEAAEESTEPKSES